MGRKKNYKGEEEDVLKEELIEIRKNGSRKRKNKDRDKGR